MQQSSLSAMTCMMRLSTQCSIHTLTSLFVDADLVKYM